MKVRNKIRTSLENALAWSQRDLRLQIALFYLLFVVPVFITAIFVGQSIERRLEADAKFTDLALARAIAQETELNLKNTKYTAQELSRYSETVISNKTEVQELSEEILRSETSTNPVFLLGDWGLVFYRPNETIGAALTGDTSYNDYFQRIDITQPLISSGRISSTTQQPVVTTVIPVWDEWGNYLGTVISNIRLEALSNTLEDILGEYSPDNEGTFQAVLIDASRQIIAHPDPDQLLKPVSNIPPEVLNEVLSGFSGNQIARSADGRKMLYSYVPVPSANWGVVIIRPTATAFAPLDAFFASTTIIIGIFTLVGVIFWNLLARRVIQPLEQLSTFSQAISGQERLSYQQNNELVRLGKRADQVGQLTKNLLSMENAIEARLHELATLLETSAAVVSSLNSQAVLNQILTQVERLLDVRMSAVVAFDSHKGVFRTQASRGLSQNAETVIIDPGEPHSVTLQAIRSHAPVQISDTEAENTLPRIKLRGRAAGYRSVLAIPLNTQYAPPSALLVFRPEPYIFSQREIDLLLSFANHATMAIENATLYARSDMRLQEQTRRIEALIQSLHDGLILENLEGRVIYANRRVSELIGLSPEEISGAHVDKIFERLLQLTGQPERIGQAIRATLDNPEETSVDIECEVKGQPVTIRIQTFKVTDSQDVSIGRGQILLDVTQDREIDRMKSRLVSTVSHELRTPLAAIKGYVTTLLAKDVHWDQASQQEFLEVILAETDRLTSLVNDLLDLSKIEAGNMALRYSECNLFEMAQSAARHAYPSPAGRLHLNVPADLPDLLVDRRLIEAVLRNLIENSVKYAGEQSQIFVHASLENGHAIVQVEDEGPGFPSAQSGAIFEDFSRLENADPFAVPGFGLGLSICRGFVRAHGGDIWVESESRGACVTFSLPLSSEVQPARDRITL